MKTTQTQHTPGPWEVESGMVQTVREHTCKVANCGVHIPIAHMDRTANNGTLPVERDANARLIASAPDLLAAATAAFQWLDYVRRWPGGQDILIETQPGGFGLDKLQAAIRAAEGGR